MSRTVFYTKRFSSWLGESRAYYDIDVAGVAEPSPTPVVTLTPTPTPSITPTQFFTLTPTPTPSSTPPICYVTPIGFGDFPITEALYDPTDDGVFFYTYLNNASVTYNGTRFYNLGKFDSDLNLVTSQTFLTNPGISGAFPASNNVSYITLNEDYSKIYLAGEFTTFSGRTDNRGIIRLNKSDLSIDTSYSGYVVDNVFSVVVDAQGNQYIGGNLDSVKYSGGTLTRTNIAKLFPDGLGDPEFSNSTGFDNTVTEIAFDSNGKLIVAGSFTNYTGHTSYSFIKLNVDGSIDTSFTSPFASVVQVGDIIVLSDDSIVFTTTVDYAGSFVYKLNPDGSIDTQFMTNIGTGWVTPTPNGVMVTDTDEIIMTNTEWTSDWNGSYAGGVVKLNPDGTRITWNNGNTNFTMNTYGQFGLCHPIRTNSDIIYFVGSVVSYDGTSYPKLVVTDDDGDSLMC